LDAGSGAHCPAAEQSALDARAQALAVLEQRVAELSAAFGAACTELALDLGESPATAGKDPASLTVDEAAAVCALASHAVKESKVSFSATAPRCYVNAPAELACEATCVHSQPCDVGTVESRCPEQSLHPVCGEPCGAGQAELWCEIELAPLSCSTNPECDAACAALGQLEGQCESSEVQVSLPSDPALGELIQDDLNAFLDARQVATRVLTATSTLLEPKVEEPASPRCRDANERLASEQAERVLQLATVLERFVGAARPSVP
jgi:hypothetical protein